MQNKRLMEWLNAALRSKEITQNELARQSGVSSATLSAIRHGHTPTLETVRALAKYFDMDVESLMEIAGLIAPLPDVPAEIPEEMRALLRRLARLPEGDRLEVMRLVDSFVSFVEARPGGPQVFQHDANGST
jgi:transcriptional regulator with XRE-family HTH domain